MEREYVCKTVFEQKKVATKVEVAEFFQENKELQVLIREYKNGIFSYAWLISNGEIPEFFDTEEVRNGLAAQKEERTWVVAVEKRDGGIYFDKFYLPETYDENIVENNHVNAVWYYMNRINFESVVKEIFSWKEYSDLREAKNEVE